jgi:hypothetical protein
MFLALDGSKDGAVSEKEFLAGFAAYFRTQVSLEATSENVRVAAAFFGAGADVKKAEALCHADVRQEETSYIRTLHCFGSMSSMILS